MMLSTPYKYEKSMNMLLQLPRPKESGPHSVVFSLIGHLYLNSVWLDVDLRTKTCV